MSGFDLLKRYVEEVDALSERPVVLSVDVQTLLLLIGALQLALRHPVFPATSKRVVLRFIETSVRTLQPEENGAISEVINRGFNPVYDEAP